MTSTDETRDAQATDTQAQVDRFDRLLDELHAMTEVLQELVQPPEEKGIDELLDTLAEQMATFHGLLDQFKTMQAEFVEREQGLETKIDTLQKYVTALLRQQMMLNRKLGLIK